MITEKSIDRWFERNKAQVWRWLMAAFPVNLRRYAMDAHFEEAEHPRDENGRFTDGSGSASEQYQSLLKTHGGNHYEASKQYFRENLQGKYVEAMISGKAVNVHFTGDSWRELKRSMKNDALKAELVTCLSDVIATGKYIDNPLYKHHGSIKQFHTFMKDVETTHGKKEVFVDVAELPVSKHRYSAYNMTHEDMPAHQTKKAALGIAPKTASDKQLEEISCAGYSPHAFHVACDENITQSFEVVNIRVV